MKICSVEGCGAPHKARGFCHLHYDRYRTGTEMEGPKRRIAKVSLAEKLTLYAPPGLPGECWEWTRGFRNGGYGQMSIGTSQSRGAHVVAWELEHGQARPKGMVIRHNCDNPPCCNPAHLELGTPADNMADRDRRRRHAFGVRHGHARLTEADVREIRARHKNERVSQFVLADDFGVSQPTISEIVNGKTWTHIE